MSLWLRVMWRDEWPRPTPSNAGVPGCEIACLIPSSISPSVTTKLPLPHRHHRSPPPPPAHAKPLRSMQLSDGPSVKFPGRAIHRIPHSRSDGCEAAHEMKVMRTHICRSTHAWVCLCICVCTYTRVCVRSPVPPEPIAQSGAKRRAISLSCCAISQPGFLLTLLTSLTCHDRRGAFRVQRLTWTPGGGGRSISFTVIIHLAFFYRFIPPSPLHHLTSSRPLSQKNKKKNWLSFL